MACGRRRLRRAGGLALILGLALAWARAGAAEIHAITPALVGHQVGGVSIDLVGDLYVADFGDLVWKITPDGERRVFATGLYGASGNTIDRDGALLQSSCYGDTVTRIDRKGEATVIASHGLSCPVGVAVDRRLGEVFVANCSSNSIARISPGGEVSTFARSPLFSCPNGIAFDAAGTLYVVNYRDNRMLKVDARGEASLFATVSPAGLGHLCFKGDRFYVTAFHSHQVYEVLLSGAARPILGDGRRGQVDGVGAAARLSYPNGIACHPSAPRLYINESLGETIEALPHRAIVREIILDGPSG